MNTDVQKLFSGIVAFEWDERKCKANLAKHGIDFDDARVVFEGPMLVAPSDRGTETRYLVLGLLETVEVAVICTFRADRCRIISARRARTYERKELQRHLKKHCESG